MRLTWSWISGLLSLNLALVEENIQAVVSSQLAKVIIETCLLTDAEKRCCLSSTRDRWRRLCELQLAFSWRATVEDVALMRQTVWTRWVLKLLVALALMKDMLFTFIEAGATVCKDFFWVASHYGRKGGSCKVDQLSSWSKEVNKPMCLTHFPNWSCTANRMEKSMGAIIENVSFGLTNCGERTISKAVSEEAHVSKSYLRTETKPHLSMWCLSPWLKVQAATTVTY